MKDPNRHKMPEVKRAEQDDQLAKYNSEESRLLEGIDKIKQLL